MTSELRSKVKNWFGTSRWNPKCLVHLGDTLLRASWHLVIWAYFWPANPRQTEKPRWSPAFLLSSSNVTLPVSSLINLVRLDCQRPLKYPNLTILGRRPFNGDIACILLFWLWIEIFVKALQDYSHKLLCSLLGCLMRHRAFYSFHDISVCRHGVALEFRWLLGCNSVRKTVQNMILAGGDT